MTDHHTAEAGRALDRFFENHLAGVKARLDTQTRLALDRQRAAWRDMLHRQALLEGKDFSQTSSGCTARSSK